MFIIYVLCICTDQRTQSPSPPSEFARMKEREEELFFRWTWRKRNSVWDEWARRRQFHCSNLLNEINGVLKIRCSMEDWKWFGLVCPPSRSIKYLHRFLGTSSKKKNRGPVLFRTYKRTHLTSNIYQTTKYKIVNNNNKVWNWISVCLEI